VLPKEGAAGAGAGAGAGAASTSAAAASTSEETQYRVVGDDNQYWMVTEAELREVAPHNQWTEVDTPYQWETKAEIKTETKVGSKATDEQAGNEQTGNEQAGDEHADSQPKADLEELRLLLTEGWEIAPESELAHLSILVEMADAWLESAEHCLPDNGHGTRKKVRQRHGPGAAVSVVPIGATIKVYWADDDAWYRASVTGEQV
jgi:hypothetical protein